MERILANDDEDGIPKHTKKVTLALPNVKPKEVSTYEGGESSRMTVFRVIPMIMFPKYRKGC